MVNTTRLDSGDRVSVIGRQPGAGSREATVIEAGQFMLRTPDDGVRTSGTSYSDAALVQFSDGSYAVVEAAKLEG